MSGEARVRKASGPRSEASEAMNERAVGDWLEGYQRAWEEADADGVARLFTKGVSYRAHIFRPPYRGREAIRDYWRTATSTQKDVTVRLGAPLIDSTRVAVEWWTRMHDADDGDVTLPGILLLRFSEGGLCSELREYWHLESRHRAPPQGWGKIGDKTKPDCRDHVQSWIEVYGRAWSRGDAATVAALFSDDVVYRSHPFRQLERGRAGALAYTKRAFETEEIVAPRFGSPVVDGASAAVEYWATMREDGRQVTLAGGDMLRFSPDGLCEELREYWHVERGWLEPPIGWGL